MICFIIMTLAVYGVVTAITEVATFLPVHGSTMSFYGHRYVSRSLGFAMGWLYFYSLGKTTQFHCHAHLPDRQSRNPRSL